MDIQDTIAFAIIIIPFFRMITFDQENLIKKKYFLIYFAIGILSWVLGALYFSQSESEEKWFVYFGSQMTLFFLIQYVIISYLYRMLFKRNPEISEIPSKNLDIVPTILIIMGTILIPLSIDSNFIKFVIK